MRTNVPAFMVSVGLAAAAFALPAAAEDWMPSKPVRMVVPVQGGTIDLIARLVGPHLHEALGQPIVVEPRPGASGNLGTDIVAKAAPDGHTILVAFTAPITVNTTLMSYLPYDPLKDLAPITLAVSTPQILVVGSGVKAKTVREFVADAKAHPGAMSYASIAIGGASHLTMEMLKTAAGIDIVHVPYRGAGPAVTDLIGGHVQTAILVPGNVMPYLADGKLRALATTGRQRFSSAPEIPTLIESGYPDFEAVAWIGFMAPGGTPKAIIERYHRELVIALKLPDVRKRLQDIQFEVVASTPEEFADYIRWETPRWAKVIKDTGAKVD